MGDFNLTYGFAPVVDGRILPRQPFDPDAPAISSAVPMIIMANKDEAVTFLRGDPRWEKFTDADVEQAYGGALGSRLAELTAAYRAGQPGITPTRIIVRIISDGMMLQSLTLADRKAAQRGAPVYVAKFVYQTNALNGTLGAIHGLDVPFTFDQTAGAMVTGTDPERFGIADKWASTIAAFAATGNPNNPAIPAWPAHHPGDMAALWVDRTFSVRPVVSPAVDHLLRPNNH